MQWLMLQQEQAEDFVIATGVQHSVRDFVNFAAAELNVTLDWHGSGVDEYATIATAPEECAAKPGTKIVAVDPRYFRPAEVETLLGDPTKAREKLGWVPKTTFAELVQEMMAEDLKAARRDSMVEKAGYRAFSYFE